MHEFRKKCTFCVNHELKVEIGLRILKAMFVFSLQQLFFKSYFRFSLCSKINDLDQYPKNAHFRVYSWFLFFVLSLIEIQLNNI